MTMTIDALTAHERDLATAAQLQRMLLPRSPLTAHGWTAAHHFEPAVGVSGDYVDLVPSGGGVYFMLGDVSGKGVSASLLMAQLHAMFRTLIPFQLPLEDLMRRASALLCASSLPAQYATLVSGHLASTGEVTIVNAGHPPPLLIGGAGHRDVRATGMPIGLFCESQFTSTQLTLAPGDTLLVYSDGLSEARSNAGDEYGADRIERSAVNAAQQPIAQFVASVIRDHAAFRSGLGNGDDVTVLAIRRSADAAAAGLAAPPECRPGEGSDS